MKRSFMKYMHANYSHLTQQQFNMTLATKVVGPPDVRA